MKNCVSHHVAMQSPRKFATEGIDSNILCGQFRLKINLHRVQKWGKIYIHSEQFFFVKWKSQSTLLIVNIKAPEYTPIKFRWMSGAPVVLPRYMAL